MYTDAGQKKNIIVANNIFYNAHVYGICVRDLEIENVILRNNICSQNGGGIRTEDHQPGLIIDHNLIDGWSPTYGDNVVLGDPKFVNPFASDFRLKKDSPAIDNGSAVAVPSEDFDANKRPIGAGYDIGAYEYVNDVVTDRSMA